MKLTERQAEVVETMEGTGWLSAKAVGHLLGIRYDYARTTLNGMYSRRIVMRRPTAIGDRQFEYRLEAISD